MKIIGHLKTRRDSPGSSRTQVEFLKKEACNIEPSIVSQKEEARKVSRKGFS